MDITVFGIPTHISPSTLLIVVLFFITGIRYIRRQYGGGSPLEYALGSLLAGIAILVSVFFHEFSHAIVARHLGIPIVAAGSNFWGAYVQSADVSMTTIQWAQIAFAGPLANIVMGLVAALFVKQMGEGVLENSIQYFARTSLMLAAFNMFPFGGLDGAAVFKGVAFAWYLLPGTFGYLALKWAMIIAPAISMGLVETWLDDL